jgi:hypothetical protein
MCQCIHTYVEVGDVNSHSLFPHSGLVCVTRRLQNLKEILVRDASTTCTNLENQFVPGYDQEME